MRSKNSRALTVAEAAHLAAAVKRLGWFDLRFVQDKSKVETDCEVCGRKMWFPKCKAGRYKTCGGDCATNRRKAQKNTRLRPCAACGKGFIPRSYQLKIGQGKFCSQACGFRMNAEINSADARARSAETRRQMRESGLIKMPSGAQNHNWKGGKEAFRLRHIERVKAFRNNNLERVKAWEHNCRVRRRNAGKLPSDTVERLLDLQGRKCAVCRQRLGKPYHLDHIVSLARGGRNEFHNVQLLCPQCNIRKSAKDPIAFMQSRGFLL